MMPLAVTACAAFGAAALERPDITFKIFHFPPDKIPRIGGNAGDGAMVPDSYVIGIDQLVDDEAKHPNADPRALDVKVRVGWVRGNDFRCQLLRHI